MTNRFVDVLARTRFNKFLRAGFIKLSSFDGITTVTFLGNTRRTIRSGFTSVLFWFEHCVIHDARSPQLSLHIPEKKVGKWRGKMLKDNVNSQLHLTGHILVRTWDSARKRATSLESYESCVQIVKHTASAVCLCRPYQKWLSDRQFGVWMDRPRESVEVLLL